MHSSLITGSMPGMAASTSDTCELGSPPNAVEAPEKSFAREVTWAWTSMPITTSQSPVAPLTSFDFISAASVNALPRGAASAAPRAYVVSATPLAILVKCFGHAPQGCHSSARAHPPSGTSIRHGRWRKSGSELMMSDNRARNGTLGAILGAVIAVALAIFLLSGGEHVGKKTVNSDADLPPIAEGKGKKLALR